MTENTTSNIKTVAMTVVWAYVIVQSARGFYGIGKMTKEAITEKMNDRKNK